MTGILAIITIFVVRYSYVSVPVYILRSPWVGKGEITPLPHQFVILMCKKRITCAPPQFPGQGNALYPEYCDGLLL